jgi:hypothetical protein
MRIGTFFAAIVASAVTACSNQTPSNEAGAAQIAVRNTVAPSATVTAARPADAPAKLGPPQGGYCHAAAGCSWFREAGREIVKQYARGRLIRVSLLGGFSTDEDAAVEWNKRRHDVFVFCSTKLPAVMVDTPNGWQVDTLDFVNDVPGQLMASALIYASVCHNKYFLDPPEAKALGYSALSDDALEVHVERPEQIFERVR